MIQKVLEFVSEAASVGVGFVVGHIINFGVTQVSILIKIIFNKG